MGPRGHESVRKRSQRPTRMRSDSMGGSEGEEVVRMVPVMAEMIVFRGIHVLARIV